MGNFDFHLPSFVSSSPDIDEVVTESTPSSISENGLSKEWEEAFVEDVRRYHCLRDTSCQDFKDQ